MKPEDFAKAIGAELVPESQYRWFGVQYIEPHACTGVACEHIAEYLGMALVKAARPAHAVSVAQSLGLTPAVPHIVSVAVVERYVGDVPEHYRNRLITDKDEVIAAVEAWERAGLC